MKCIVCNRKIEDHTRSDSDRCIPEAAKVGEKGFWTVNALGVDDAKARELCKMPPSYKSTEKQAASFSFYGGFSNDQGFGSGFGGSF